LAIERGLLGSCSMASEGADDPDAGTKYCDGGDEQQRLVVSGERHASEHISKAVPNGHRFVATAVKSLPGCGRGRGRGMRARDAGAVNGATTQTSLFALSS
jgi:hypothetical protein